jgi:hypothetical protein
MLASLFCWFLLDGRRAGAGGGQFLEERKKNILNPAQEKVSQSHCKVLV